MSLLVDSIEVYVEDEEFGEDSTVHVRLAEVVRSLRREGAPSMWWCNVLHLGYREDGTPGARTGFPQFCRDEAHGPGCGWFVLLSGAFDRVDE